MTTVTLPIDDEAVLPAITMPIRPWPDPVIDAVGHDPRSAYVETFWLGILGPSTTWLLRRLAAGLESAPDGFDLDLADSAQALGLGARGGRNSPFMRALGRCCRFEMARMEGECLAVRRKVPPLSRRQIVRLPSTLQEAHDEWQRARLGRPVSEEMDHRCRRLALSLVELGEDREATEAQLLEWRFHPALAASSTAWAFEAGRSAPG